MSEIKKRERSGKRGERLTGREGRSEMEKETGEMEEVKVKVKEERVEER